MMVFAVGYNLFDFPLRHCVTFSSSHHVSVSRLSHIRLWRNHGADLLHLLPLSFFSCVVLYPVQDLTNPQMLLRFETAVSLLVLSSSSKIFYRKGEKEDVKATRMPMQAPIVEKDKDRVERLAYDIENTTLESQYPRMLYG